MNFFVAYTSADCFCDSPHTHIIHDLQLLCQFFHRQICEIIRNEAVYMLLQRADGFHQRTFKVVADTHHLSGCLHLCSQCSLCTDKLIKRKSRKFYDTVVQHWFKACICLLCDRIFDLIQCITKSDLCCNLRDRISCRFGSQRRRTADTRVYLDYTVFKCLRVQSILYVTSTRDIQLTDNI